jgi:superfamily II DNA or RNA helicase
VHVPSPGDVVWIRRQAWRVEAIHTGSGLTRVRASSTVGAHGRTFLLPVEPWWRDRAGRPRRVSARYARAWLAARAASMHPAGVPASMVRADTTLLAYQLEPAMSVLAGTRRVLIADAVGLGKTIQAALIVSEILASRADARALVLAPAPLLGQWAAELHARFHIATQVADTMAFARLRAERPYLASPWSGPGVWLASPDYIKQPHVRDAMPRERWDLVVIDEAHMMAGDSQRGDCAHAIAVAAGHVVLLTATPHDGDDTRFRRLMSLGATGARADTIRVFRRLRASVSRRVRTIHLRPGAATLRVLAGIDAFERTVRPESRTEHRHALHLLCSLFRKRVLSSLAALVASLERRLAWIDLREAGACAGSIEEQLCLFPADVVPGDEWLPLTSDAGLPAERERAWLQGLRDVADANAAGAGDPRLRRLHTLLRRGGEPAVVFTEYRDTLLAAARRLQDGRGLAVLHGGLAPAEQRRALSAFLDGQADTLLATDVASQGLNLQHRARWVICLDVPWNPMRLEQRVGRVDRIGQPRGVHLTLLATRHAADAALRTRVSDRQDASAQAPLASCNRWRHAALGVAQLFARQRALATRWRGPDPMRLPRARVPAAFVRRVCGVSAGPLPSPLTIVEIPIVSADGVVLERHLGWHGGGPGAKLAPELISRVRVLETRARRHVARTLAARNAGQHPAPEQPGLFDQRALILAGGTHDPGVPSPAEQTVTDHRVHVGPPRAVLVLEIRGTRR